MRNLLKKVGKKPARSGEKYISSPFYRSPNDRTRPPHPERAPDRGGDDTAPLPKEARPAGGALRELPGRTRLRHGQAGALPVPGAKADLRQVPGPLLQGAHALPDTRHHALFRAENAPAPPPIGHPPSSRRAQATALRAARFPFPRAKRAATGGRPRRLVVSFFHIISKVLASLPFDKLESCTNPSIRNFLECFFLAKRALKKERFGLNRIRTGDLRCVRAMS